MSEIERDNARLATATDKTAPKELLALGELVQVTEGDFSERARETIHRLFKKLILNNSLPAVLSPTGEQLPTVETETALETESPLAFAQEHPCPYRTLGNVKGNAAETQVLCAETDKLPLAACITRQKRYLHFEHSCQPLAKQRILEKMTKPQRQQPTTRPFKGNDHEQEGVLPRFYCPDGHTPTFCHGNHPCDKRLTCAESRQYQPSR